MYKLLVTAIFSSQVLPFSAQSLPSPTSEPKGRLLLLLKKTFTDFWRKSKRQSEYRLVQRQSLTVITTDAESDLLTVAQFAQFAQLCLCSFGTTRTFLICQPPGLIAKCGKCAVSATSQASTMPPFSLGRSPWQAFSYQAGLPQAWHDIFIPVISVLRE